MIILSRSKITFIACCLLFISIVMVIITNKPALSCDVAVVSGNVTTDGKPILWKNFDCSSYWKQEIKYFPAKNSTAGDYFFLYHNDDTMEAINGSPFMPQSGANAAGFAASVAAVYEDLAPLHESGNLNTDLLQHAVEECATIADWENLLKTWPSSHYNHAISANYVVVDAHGGAALYECYTGKYTHGLMKIQYRKTDANTGEVVDNTGKVISAAKADFPGFVTRTNLNNYVWYNSGVDRYLRAKRLLTDLAVKGRLNAQNLMQIVSKDVVGKQYQTGGDTKYSTTYCISRNQTRSGTVFQGVPAGADPCQTVYWTALGEPSISVYVPNMIGAKSVSEYVYMDKVDNDGDMKDKSDTCLLNIAEDERETYNNLIHSSNRGSVLTGPYNKYINKIELAKAQEWILAIENTVINKTADLLNQLNIDPTLMDPEYLKSFTNYCGKYIYDNYIAASATAVPWDFANVPVTDVTLSDSSLNLFVGETASLTAAVSPDNASNPAVSWSSSDPTIAAVDQTGKVTAVASGTAIITVTTADGAKTAACSVTVNIPEPGAALDSIAITTPPDKLVYHVGDMLDITGMVVTGTYSDNSTRAETVTAADVTGFDSSAEASSQTLTVTVGGKTAEFTVEIKAVTPESLIKAAIAKFAPVTGNMKITETLPYLGSIRVNKIIVSPGTIDGAKQEKSTLIISTLFTSTTTVPVFPFAELIAGPEATAVDLVSTGTLTEDADNYIITLTDVECPQSLLNICCKTDIIPILVMNHSDQKLDCQIKISKATGLIVSVDKIKIIGTTNTINGTSIPNTFQADSLTLSYDIAADINTKLSTSADTQPNTADAAIPPDTNNTATSPDTADNADSSVTTEDTVTQINPDTAVLPNTAEENKSTE